MFAERPNVCEHSSKRVLDKKGTLGYTRSSQPCLMQYLRNVCGCSAGLHSPFSNASANSQKLSAGSGTENATSSFVHAAARRPL